MLIPQQPACKYSSIAINTTWIIIISYKTMAFLNKNEKKKKKQRIFLHNIRFSESVL
jgi:hypothetical protein